MGEQELKKMAEEKGLETEKPEYSGRGRPPGAFGGLPNLKTMGKRELMTELGKSRKKLKELEESLAARAGFPGAKTDELLAIPPELWAFLPTAIYDYMASRFGEHWKLKEPEARAFGQALEKVANRYLPALAGDMPELFGLFMVIAGTAIPRVVVTVKLIQKAKADKARALEVKAETSKQELLKGDTSKNAGSDLNHGTGAKGKREKLVDKKTSSRNP